MPINGEEAFQMEGIARIKALRQERARLVWEAARRSMWVEQSERGLTTVEGAF